LDQYAAPLSSTHAHCRYADSHSRNLKICSTHLSLLISIVIVIAVFYRSLIKSCSTVLTATVVEHLPRFSGAKDENKDENGEYGDEGKDEARTRTWYPRKRKRMRSESPRMRGKDEDLVFKDEKRTRSETPRMSDKDEDLVSEDEGKDEE